MRLRSARHRPAQSIEALLPVFDETGHQRQSTPVWRELPSCAAEAAELRRTVRAAIEELPEPCRVALLLRDVEELDTQAAAEALGLSVPAMKTRLHGARQALRTLLEERMGSDLVLHR